MNKPNLKSIGSTNRLLPTFQSVARKKMLWCSEKKEMPSVNITIKIVREKIDVFVCIES